MDSGTLETPTASRTFLTAEWRYLALLNYEVGPQLLAGFVPVGTELDSWSGKTFVSLVGFRFLKTRVFGIPFPFHCNFDEVNLRFYVRRTVGSEIRRGVVFVREIVPRRAIAIIARAFYGERYLALPMNHSIEVSDEQVAVEYGWRFSTRRNVIRLTTIGDAYLPAEGSAEQFITEHYWGYAATKDAACVEYQVRHPQWKVWSAGEASFDGNMEALYGKDLNDVLRGRPDSAFLAEGSAVSVQRGRRLKDL
jgi:uncharacterized protein YqjF (DUF2071 family)